MSDSQSPSEPERMSPQLAAALDQLAEGVIITDETGSIIFVNAAAAAIHGVKQMGVDPDAYAQTYRLFTLDGDPYPSDQLPLTRAVRKGETVEHAAWLIERSDGQSVIAVGTARPVLGDDGQQIGAVLTLRDETVRQAERKALEDALAMKDLLLREIHHRVKNNLQLVSSLLSLQGRRTIDETARAALGDLAARVDIIADIHRALYDAGETDTIEVVGYLERLCGRHLAPLAEASGVRFAVTASGRCTLPIEKATSVALALNELTLNSLKHAFADTGDACIELAITTREGALALEYRDNGAGLAGLSDEPDAGATGFGQLLISGLERQLGATIEQASSASGFTASISVPFDGNLVAAA